MKTNDLITRFLDGLTSPEEERQLRATLEAKTTLTADERAVLDLLCLSFPEEDTAALLAEDVSQSTNHHSQFFFRRLVVVSGIAAAVILAFILWPERQEKTVEQPEQQVVIAEVQQPEKQDVIDVKKEKRLVPMIVQEPQVIVQSVPVRRTDENLTHQEVAVESEALRSDSFDYYLARLESEMEAMDDSVSLAQLEKLISADARLRQLVNRIVNGEVQQALNVAKPDSTTDYLNF